MDTARDTVQNVYNTVTRTLQSGTEPPSGHTGAGTADSPYDQGNATEPPTTTAKATGTEPPSGQQGRGTIDEPYDQGNAPVQATAPGTEPPSGQQGKGTVDEPYDQGNQPEQSKSGPTSAQPTYPASTDPLASPSTTHQGSGNPMMAPTKEQEQAISESRGRDEAAQRTTSTPGPAGERSTGTAARGGGFDAARTGAGEEASRLRYEERDVSPGELKDGTHAITSGLKGEGYNPGKFNKFKDKFGIGRDRK